MHTWVLGMALQVQMMNNEKGMEDAKCCQISRFGFQCVAMNIESVLKICNSYWVYNQI